MNFGFQKPEAGRTALEIRLLLRSTSGFNRLSGAGMAASLPARCLCQSFDTGRKKNRDGAGFRCTFRGAKDDLKARSYRWHDGTTGPNRHWWKEIAEEALAEEKAFLDELYAHGSERAGFSFKSASNVSGSCRFQDQPEHFHPVVNRPVRLVPQVPDDRPDPAELTLSDRLA